MYFDILMFFSFIQNRENIDLHITENFTIQLFFDLRKLRNIQLNLWDSIFTIVSNQYFLVYKRHKKGRKYKWNYENMFFEIKVSISVLALQQYEIIVPAVYEILFLLMPTTKLILSWSWFTRSLLFYSLFFFVHNYKGWSFSYTE